MPGGRGCRPGRWSWLRAVRAGGGAAGSPGGRPGRRGTGGLGPAGRRVAGRAGHVDDADDRVVDRAVAGGGAGAVSGTMAHVTELTGLLREGPHGDQMDGWPAPMRGFRPPGAAASRCPAELVRDPGRLALLPVGIERARGLRGWRAQLGYIDATHRVHARVEDCIRTGKDCGIGTISRRIPRGWPSP